MKKIVCIVFILVLLFNGNPVFAGKKYHTYKVVKVTRNTVILERRVVNRNVDIKSKSYGKTIKVSIDRSRRPDLKVGDRVRYNKKKDRLRKTLSKK